MSAALPSLPPGLRIGVEYQPMVEPVTSRIVAYEALSRFHDRHGRPLPPEQVFQRLHAHPNRLFAVELHCKRVQIAHAPPGVRLYLNLDPHAFVAGGDDDDNPLLDLLASRPDLAVEIIENSSVTDSRHSLAMVRHLRTRGIRVALDDIGGGDSLISFEVMAGVDDLKIARDWIDRRHAPVHRRLLAALAGFARDTGKRLIYEGIETRDHLDWATVGGADLVQGFLYRHRFVTWTPAPDEAGQRSELVPAGDWR